MDQYLNVLLESILATLPFPLSSTPTFFAMHGFGGFNMLFAVAAAVLGSAIGSTISYLIGYLALLMHQKSGEVNLSRRSYDKASGWFRRYFLFLLPFSWLPLLTLLAPVAAFFSVNPRLVLPLIIAGYIFRYSYYLFV